MTMANTIPKNPKLPKWETLEAALMEDDGNGFCLACGEDASSFVEPDATHYQCGQCDENQVFGAQEILFMFQWPEDK